MGGAWRHQWLDRARLATRITAAELAVAAVLAVSTVVEGASGFWVPLAVAAPLVAVELWYDMRSRSRRLVPAADERRRRRHRHNRHRHSRRRAVQRHPVLRAGFESLRGYGRIDVEGRTRGAAGSRRSEGRIVPYLVIDGDTASPTKLGGTSVLLHHYVTDVDAAVERAVQEGATLPREPADQFHGDRAAVILDPFGHQWSLHTHLRDVSPEEIAEAAAAMAHDDGGHGHT